MIKLYYLNCNIYMKFDRYFLAVLTMWRTIESQHLPAVDSVMIVLIKKSVKQLFIFLWLTDTVLNQLVKCFSSPNKYLKRGRARD